MLEDLELLAYEYYPLDMIECNLYGHLLHAIKNDQSDLMCGDIMPKIIFDKYESYIEDFCRRRNLKCIVFWDLLDRMSKLADFYKKMFENC